MGIGYYTKAIIITLQARLYLSTQTGVTTSKMQIFINICVPPFFKYEKKPCRKLQLSVALVGALKKVSSLVERRGREEESFAINCTFQTISFKIQVFILYSLSRSHPFNVHT